MSPIKHLDSLDLLSSRTLLAHCIHLTEEEIDLLAERGWAVAHCSVSNLKLGSGIAPVKRMLEAGVKIALGTDGPVSGNDLNLWLTMRLAARLTQAGKSNTKI